MNYYPCVHACVNYYPCIRACACVYTCMRVWIIIRVREWSTYACVRIIIRVCACVWIIIRGCMHAGVACMCKLLSAGVCACVNYYSCMRACLWIIIRACMRACMWIIIHVHAWIIMCELLFVGACMRVHACVWIIIRECAYMHVHELLSVCVRACTHVCELLSRIKLNKFIPTILILKVERYGSRYWHILSLRGPETSGFLQFTWGIDHLYVTSQVTAFNQRITNSSVHL